MLASTFPRWNNDTVPTFIKDLAESLISTGDLNILVLVPHYIGAKPKEVLDSALLIERLKYFWPAEKQNLFYEGGGATARKKSLGFVLKTLIYSLHLFFCTLRKVCFGRYKIIHAHWLVPQGIVAVVVGKLTKCKVIVTVHGGDVFTLNGRIAKFIKLITLKYADSVAVNSSVTLEACRHICDREYVLAPMGVDLKLFSENSSSLQSQDRKTVLFVGRIVEQKGLRYLINAMASVDADLMVVGDGPELAGLKQYARECALGERIIFKGWVDHHLLGQIYRNATVFVAPSITLENGWREGMGLVYLEAMCAGLPVVTTASTGARDFIFDGKNGYVVNEKNTEELAIAINNLLSNELSDEQFSKVVGEVLDFYNWGSCADRYRELYEIDKF